MDAPGPDRPPATSGAASPQADAQLYLHPQTLARLGTMELRAKMIVEGLQSGTHRSPYHGFSVEFAQHRPYVPGDDIRHLDWKVYARSDRLHLKQYQQETNLDLVLMVDASGSMDYGTRSFADASGIGRAKSPDDRTYWSKFDHATAVAAALSYVTLKQGDRVGLVTYADQVLTMVNRSSAQGQWRQIVGALATHPVDAQTDLARAVDQTMAKVTNRALVAIISDFFEDPEQIRSALARLRHRGHDAMLFQIIDRTEETFEFSDGIIFEGLEGEPRVKIDPRAIRDSYLEAMRKHMETVKRAGRRFGFDFQRVSTHEWLGPTISSFVARRAAQIKQSKYG